MKLLLTRSLLLVLGIGVCCSGVSNGSARVSINDMAVVQSDSLAVGVGGAFTYQLDATFEAEVDGCDLFASSDCGGNAVVVCNLDIEVVSVPNDAAVVSFSNDTFFDFYMQNDGTWFAHSEDVENCVASHEVGFQADVAGEYVLRFTVETGLSARLGSEVIAFDDQTSTEEITVNVE